MSERPGVICTITCPLCATLVEVPVDADLATMTAAVAAHELSAHGDVADQQT